MFDNGELLGEYTYNAMGQRVVKTVNGIDTVFLYGFDDKLIAESQANGVFIAEYIHRGDNALAKVECSTNTVYYYLNDYLGQPKALVDDQEQAVWEANYLPFGQAIVNPNSSVENNLRLLGQYYDEETELHYNYHRYYDPASGRYLRHDPIGLAGGINPFIYTSNNPINAVDSYGLIKEIKFIESGKKDALGYGAIIIVKEDGNTLFTGTGSTFPDDSTIDPVIYPGIYHGSKEKMATKGILGIYILYNPPVNRQGDPSTSSSIFIHCGRKNSRARGSEGCLTINPEPYQTNKEENQCKEFLKLFDMHEKVTVEINR